MATNEIHSILVAVDISHDGNAVCAFARNLARALGAQVTALYVVEELPEGLRGLDLPALRPEDDVPGQEQEALRRLRDHARENLGPDAGLYVTAGEPAREILRVARERGIDLVVMGNHGRKGLAKALYGSTVQEVTEAAAVPVLTVPVPG